MNRLSLYAAAIALTLSAFPAAATTVTLGGTPNSFSGMTSSVAGASVQGFEAGLPSNYTISGPGGVVSGSVTNVYLAPTGDTTKYLTTGVGSATATYAGGINYLGLYWGSVDTFNTLTLTTTTGATQSFTGSNLPGFTPDSSTSVYVNFFADPGVTWKAVTFASTSNSFELDNVATATPEPASIAMIATGLLALGGTALRRRKQTAN